MFPIAHDFTRGDRGLEDSYLNSPLAKCRKSWAQSFLGERFRNQMALVPSTGCFHTKKKNTSCSRAISSPPRSKEIRLQPHAQEKQNG